MCRVLVYLGGNELLENLIIKPKVSLVNQTLYHRYGTILNLAGFGFSAWNNDFKCPLIYKSLNLSFFDRNLESICKTYKATSVLAHIRGVSLNTTSQVNRSNIHPFLDSHETISFAHNGFLHHLDEMKKSLMKYIKNQYFNEIHGTTDSEWIRALVFSQLHSSDDYHNIDALCDAIKKSVKILKKIRKKIGVCSPSPINLFISTPNFAITLRYVLDYGRFTNTLEESRDTYYHSMWYTFGEHFQSSGSDFVMSKGTHKSIIIASEPLTENIHNWLQVPTYTMLVAERKKDCVQHKLIHVD